MTYYSIIISNNIVPYIVVTPWDIVDKNTMAFNSNRRIAGKWKEGEAIAEAVEDPNFDSKLDLIT